MARHSRKAHRKTHRRQSRKAHRKSHRRQQGGAQCAAIPLQNSVFAQKGGMAPYEVGGNDLLMDKAAMVQAQSYDQLGLIREAGSLAAAAQHGGRRSRKHHSRRHRRSQKQHARRHRRSQKQRGGMSPFDADPMLLPKSAYPFTGVNAQWMTEASVQPALKMGAGPQASA